MTILVNDSFVANAKPQRRTLLGREYYVVPVSMIVEGVLNGSRGPLYYPQSEIDRNPTAWNHIPIVLNHPKKGDTYISARDPDTLNEYGLGMVLQSKGQDGLKAFGWFDIENTRAKAPGIFADIEAGRPVELSTGLGSNVEEKVGTFNGASYVGVARNYQPDHLAVLDSEKGACSIAQGCGVNVNSTGTGTGVLQDTGTETGSGSVVNCSCGGSCDPCKAKLNANTTPHSREDQSMDRDKIIAELIGNASTHWTEEDKSILEGFSDDKLQAVANEAKPKEAPKPTPKADDAVANAAKQGASELVANEAAPKELTEEEWLKNAPASIRSAVVNAMDVEAEAKADAIKVITANEANGFTQEQLIAKPLSELKLLANLAKSKADEAPTGSAERVRRYLGAGGGRAPIVNEDKIDKDDNDFPPITNWAKELQDANS